mmetsp:Transcript_25053/g.24524  ORF Transcript_25053/g.24524 Transcript_25053/m.24524 type:complete len:88 (-) Transcript_25053:538-801(-)
MLKEIKVFLLETLTEPTFQTHHEVLIDGFLRLECLGTLVKLILLNSLKPELDFALELLFLFLFFNLELIFIRELFNAKIIDVTFLFS